VKKKILTDSIYAACVWAVIIVVCLIITHTAIMPLLSGHFKQLVVVPDLTGLTEDEAVTALEDLKLHYAWHEEGQYSATIPKGAIMLQTPFAGKEVKENRTVYLKISKGLREVLIPDLRGKSKRQAEITLHQLGLKIGKSIRSAHALIPRGVVIRTEPSSNTMVTIGDPVDLVVSSARKSGTLILPSVVGLSYNRAVELLDSVGFLIGEKKVVQDTSTLPLTVLDQQPRSGEYLQTNTRIDLTVAE